MMLLLAEVGGTQLVNQLKSESEIAKHVFHGKAMVNNLLCNTIPSAARCLALAHKRRIWCRLADPMRTHLLNMASLLTQQFTKRGTPQRTCSRSQNRNRSHLTPSLPP